MDYDKDFDCVDHNKVWNILREMGMRDHLTCLLRNLCAGQEATVRAGQQTDSKLGKEKVKAVHCHPASLTYMQSTSCKMPGWMKHKLEIKIETGIKITRKSISIFRYADDTTVMAESEEELKIFLIQVKDESEKGGLRLNIQKTKTMAFGPITSWQIDGETIETERDYLFFFGGGRSPKSL